MGYFMGCESELIYRIWNPDKNKVVRVLAARVDDGEGLDDLQDGLNRNDRVLTRTIPERVEEVNESESEESGSDTSDSQHSLVNDLPGDQPRREDFFMLGAIQSDSDVHENQNNDTQPPAFVSGSEFPSVDTNSELVQENANQDPNPPENSESHTSGSDSSSGEESPFFQRRNQPVVQMAKRKYSSKEQDDEKRQKREKAPQQSKHEKCIFCTKSGLICDGTHPFPNKCSNCEKFSRKCYSQDIDPKSIKRGKTP